MIHEHHEVGGSMRTPVDGVGLLMRDLGDLSRDEPRECGMEGDGVGMESELLPGSSALGGGGTRVGSVPGSALGSSSDGDGSK